MAGLSLHQVCGACQGSVLCDRYLETTFEAVAWLPRVLDPAANQLKI